MPKRCLSLFSTSVAILLVFTMFIPAAAVSLRPTSFNEMRRSAERVVSGKVASLTSERTDAPDCHGVLTRMRVSEVETLAGADASARTLDVLLPGGTIGGMRVTVPGAPKFESGERVVLFLRDADNGDFALLGHGLGVLRRSADGAWITPEIPLEGGPGSAGEAFEQFKQRLNAPLAIADGASNAGVTQLKVGLAIFFAALLLLAVVVKRRRSRAALMLAGLLAAGFSICETTPLAAPAESRDFKAAGPVWNLSAATFGRVDGNRVLWVRGVGTPDLDDNTSFSIIASKFKQWEDIPESAIAFRQDGVSLESGTGIDDRNTVSFLEKVPKAFFDQLTLAITFLVSVDDGKRLIDTDIVFNDRDVQWVPSGTPISLDVVALHEVGHLLGLDHTADPADVMFPTAKGVVVFSAGDRQGAATLYPVPAPAAPIASLVASPTTGAAPLAVSFSSGGSSSRIGETLKVAWDFGDGTPASAEVAPSHTYAAAGIFNAKLTVTDSAGSTTAMTQIVVGGAGSALTATKFSFNSELLTPLKLTKGKDKIALTLSGLEMQAGDAVSLVVGVVEVGALGTDITLDSKLSFKGVDSTGGKLSAKFNDKKREFSLSLSGASIGTRLDPRARDDTSTTGSATTRVLVLLKRGGATTVSSADVSYSFKVKASNQPNGFLEKTISAKK